VNESSPSGFSPGWLALREPVDHRSRAEELVDPLGAWWSSRAGSEVLDLACGTGSNLRYLAPRLPGPASWTLVDHDAALLARVLTPPGARAVRTIHADLTDVPLRLVAAAHLVTASALLDLVSEDWLVALIDACVAARCAVLFALTYDGRIEWSTGAREPEAADALVTTAVNEHQRRDKGFGPALGPAASRTLERLLRARGYTLHARPSDWVLEPADAAMVDALVDGWARAASEQSPAHAESVRAWARQRGDSGKRGRFTLRVGHQDVLALPPSTATR
jgi:SAM-dependent methyltransferase